MTNHMLEKWSCDMGSDAMQWITWLLVCTSAKLSWQEVMTTGSSSNAACFKLKFSLGLPTLMCTLWWLSSIWNRNLAASEFIGCNRKWCHDQSHAEEVVMWHGKWCNAVGHMTSCLHKCKMRQDRSNCGFIYFSLFWCVSCVPVQHMKQKSCCISIYIG